MFHAGRPFPEWDHVESKSPSSGLAALTHLPPRGKAVAPMPSLPRMGREVRDASLLLRRRWPEGPEEVFRAGRFFPERDSGESKSPSSGLAALTHLPPRGKAVASMLSLHLRGREARDSAFLFCHSYQEEF